MLSRQYLNGIRFAHNFDTQSRSKQQIAMICVPIKATIICPLFIITTTPKGLENIFSFLPSMADTKEPFL